MIYWHMQLSIKTCLKKQQNNNLSQQFTQTPFYVGPTVSEMKCHGKPRNIAVFPAVTGSCRIWKSDKKILQKTVGFRHQMQTNKKLIVTTTNTTTILV